MYGSGGVWTESVHMEEETAGISWSTYERRTLGEQKRSKNRTELNQKDSRCDVFYAASGTGFSVGARGSF